MRSLLIFPLMPLLLVGQYSGEPRRAVLGRDTRVESHSIALDSRDPGRLTVGPLHYLGGWELKGRDPAFGSFSAMVPLGPDLLFLSDAGNLVRMRIADNGAISDVRFGDLPDGPGRGWSKEDRDTEAMAHDPASGRFWVSYERSDAIWRYAPGLARAEAQVSPPEMRKWPNNGGAEAMVRLRSGRFLVFSEAGKGPKGGRAALAFDRDPTDPAALSERFYYRAPKGFRVTDAVELDDGRLLVLHRRITPMDVWKGMFAASLSVLDPGGIKRGAIVEGREIARFEPPLAVDNMEALAITHENGRQILWMASDDNATPLLQRTIVLKFALADAI